MGEKTAAEGTHSEAFLEEAKGAGRARIAQARGDAEAVAWAEKNADVLERRLRDRGVSQSKVLGYVFDDTVLVSLGGGDHGPGALLASLDNRDIRVCIPAVTLAYAFAVLPPQRCVELLGIIEAVPNAAVEPLSDALAALELAELIEVVPGDASAAHVLAAARKQDMEIITVDRARWRRVEEELSFAVALVELTDEP